MIYGIGVDIVEISRIKNLLRLHGIRFLKRIAHNREIKQAPKLNHPPTQRTLEYWAARFAAKEAFAKALGTGIGSAVSFQSVQVLKNKMGKPKLLFSKPLQAILKKNKIALEAYLSLTHSSDYAIAMVVLEKKL